MSFALKISKTIDNHIWKITFSVDSNKIPESDKSLMLKFGEPSISVGGTFGTVSPAGQRYIGVVGASSAAGTGATFTIERNEQGGVENVILTAGGSGYTIGEQITILGSSIGGLDTVDNLTVEVTGVLTLSGDAVDTFTTGIGTVPAPLPGVNTFSLPEKFIRVRTDLPFTQTFDSKSSTFAANTQAKAELFEAAFVERYSEAFSSLRALNDTFTGEAIVNI
jgi:hypothetical protein